MKTRILVAISAVLSSTAIFAATIGEVRAPSPGGILEGEVAEPPPAQWKVKDPYRQIGNVVWTVSAPDVKSGWVEFTGRVWNVQRGGVCMRGFYTGSGSGTDGDGVDFFVANFPYAVADDDLLGRNSTTMTVYVAKAAGTYTYNTVAGGTKTLHKLDYGDIYVPPPLTPEQIEAQSKAAADAKAKTEAAKKAGQEKALAANQAAADKGDAYGLLRMGERYRDGDGVEKDLTKAKDFLAKAAAAGSFSAQTELEALNKQTNAPPRYTVTK